MELDDLRDRLNAVDRQIIDLVAERETVVDRIGELKRARGLQTRDFRREKEVVDAARARGGALGLPEPLVEQLMELLIRSSLSRQERDRVRAEGRGRGRAALVIGGAGKMGRWFADFLDSQGYAVTIADPGPSVGGFAQVASWEDTPDDFDLTVVSTPLAIMPGVLDAIAECGRRGLVFDVGSLKSPLVASLRRLADAGVRVASVHPMFGPDTDLLSGRHVLFVDTGVPEATREARALFDSTMARQIEMPLEDHDRLIAYVLGLSHALNIAFFAALAESGERLPRLAELSSTTFDAQLAVAARVAQESPGLYFEIQARNPHGLDALHALRGAVEQLTGAVERADRDAFVTLMDRGRNYLARRR